MVVGAEEVAVEVDMEECCESSSDFFVLAFCSTCCVFARTVRSPSIMLIASAYCSWFRSI